MNPIDFIQLGGIAVAMVVLGFIVEKFLKNQDKRDERFIQFIGTQEDNFKNTVDNHLKDNSNASRQLAETIKELLEWLKYHNGKK